MHIYVIRPCMSCHMHKPREVNKPVGLAWVWCLSRMKMKVRWKVLTILTIFKLRGRVAQSKIKPDFIYFTRNNHIEIQWDLAKMAAHTISQKRITQITKHIKLEVLSCTHITKVLKNKTKKKLHKYEYKMHIKYALKRFLRIFKDMSASNIIVLCISFHSLWAQVEKAVLPIYLIAH